MNCREKRLQKLMEKKVKVSTLLTYRFKTDEIIHAIRNIITNSSIKKWYFLQLEELTKQRKIQNKKAYQNRKLFNRKKINFCFEQSLQQEPLDLSLTKQKQLLILEIENLLVTINKRLGIEQFKDSSLVNDPPMQQEPLDLSLTNLRTYNHDDSQSSNYQDNVTDIVQKLLTNINDQLYSDSCCWTKTSFNNY